MQAPVPPRSAKLQYSWSLQVVCVVQLVASLEAPPKRRRYQGTDCSRGGELVGGWVVVRDWVERPFHTKVIDAVPYALLTDREVVVLTEGSGVPTNIPSGCKVSPFGSEPD